MDQKSIKPHIKQEILEEREETKYDYELELSTNLPRFKEDPETEFEDIKEISSTEFTFLTENRLFALYEEEKNLNEQIITQTDKAYQSEQKWQTILNDLGQRLQTVQEKLRHEKENHNQQERRRQQEQEEWQRRFEQEKINWQTRFDQEQRRFDQEQRRFDQEQINWQRRFDQEQRRFDQEQINWQTRFEQERCICLRQQPQNPIQPGFPGGYPPPHHPQPNATPK